MESLDSPPPSSQIEWMYMHKLTETTVASCVVVESSVLYTKVYYYIFVTVLNVYVF